MRYAITRKTLQLGALIVLSVTFLMGDFCSDIFSLPIKVDYEAKDVEFELSLPKALDAPADLIRSQSGDYLPREFALAIQHQTVDLLETNPDLKQYKGNVAGVFVRGVTYTLDENSIHTDLPALRVYISPLIHSDDPDGENSIDWNAHIDESVMLLPDQNGDLQSTELACERNENATCAAQFDALMPVDGYGAYGSVMLGATDEIVDGPPQEDGSYEENLLTLQSANADRLSGIITSDFAFEVLVIPTSRIYITESDLGEMNDDLVGVVRIKLRLVLVVVAEVT